MINQTQRIMYARPMFGEYDAHAPLWAEATPPSDEIAQQVCATLEYQQDMERGPDNWYPKGA